jgi:hypothetical protein
MLVVERICRLGRVLGFRGFGVEDSPAVFPRSADPGKGLIDGVQGSGFGVQGVSSPAFRGFEG